MHREEKTAFDPLVNGLQTPSAGAHGSSHTSAASFCGAWDWEALATACALPGLAKGLATPTAPRAAPASLLAAIFMPGALALRGLWKNNIHFRLVSFMYNVQRSIC